MQVVAILRLCTTSVQTMNFHSSNVAEWPNEVRHKYMICVIEAAIALFGKISVIQE